MPQEICSESESENIDGYKSEEDTALKLFGQHELNNSLNDLNLRKGAAQLLGSKLETKKNLLKLKDQ